MSKYLALTTAFLFALAGSASYAQVQPPAQPDTTATPGQTPESGAPESGTTADPSSPDQPQKGTTTDDGDNGQHKGDHGSQSSGGDEG